MNNRLLTISNAILAIAVLVLFILQFKGNKQAQSINADSSDELLPQSNLDNTELEKTEQDGALDTSSLLFPNAKTVFINTDTLFKKLEYIQKMIKQIESKQEKLEADLVSRSQVFEKEYLAAQQMASTMTQQQALDIEQKLTKKQQEFIEYKDKVSEEIMREDQKLTDAFRKLITNYLNKLGQEMGYDYIISYSSSNPVFYGNPRYDITNEVIKKLNKDYLSGKTK